MLSPAATMYSARVRISSSRLNLDCFHCIRNSNPLCVYVPEKLLEILDTLSFTKTRRLSDVVGNLIKGLHPTCSCSRLSEHINLVAPRGRGAVWRLSALFFRSPNYLPSNPVKKHSPTEWCRNNSPRRAVALREDGPSCGLWPAKRMLQTVYQSSDFLLASILTNTCHLSFWFSRGLPSLHSCRLLL